LICLPGENFSASYLGNWTNLMTQLCTRFRVHAQFGYNSDVYACRNWFVGRANEIKPDWVLWMDDDNLLGPESFNKLWEAANDEDAPEIMAAWCWIYDQQKNAFTVSCGTVLAGNSIDGRMTKSADPRAFSGGVELFDYTGFPAVLHRYQVLGRLCDKPFKPYPGVPGEDVAFSVRAREAGMKIGVHTGVLIPHIKPMNLMPDMSNMRADTDDM
jgi:hypothetical protein